MTNFFAITPGLTALHARFAAGKLSADALLAAFS